MVRKQVLLLQKGKIWVRANFAFLSVFPDEGSASR